MKRIVSALLLCGMVGMLFAGAVAAQEKTKLVWWGWFPTQEDFAIIKEKFEAKNPEIELEATRFMYDDYVNKLKLEFTSGTGPDLLSMKDGALLAQFRPYLVDLKPLIAGWQDQIVPNILADAVAKSGEGQLLAVPLGMSSQMFVYYNATLL